MSNCGNCNGKDKNTPENVPYLVHESEMARAERTIKRLWITTLILIFMLVGTNAAWIWYENQFEDVVTTTYEADAMDGGNAVINGEGSVNINGESEGNDN